MIAEDAVDYWVRQLSEPDVETNRALAPGMIEALVADRIVEALAKGAQPAYRFELTYRLEDDGRKVEITRLTRRVMLTTSRGGTFPVWNKMIDIRVREVA